MIRAVTATPRRRRKRRGEMVDCMILVLPVGSQRHSDMPPSTWHPCRLLVPARDLVFFPVVCRPCRDEVRPRGDTREFTGSMDGRGRRCSRGEKQEATPARPVWPSANM